MGLSEKEFQDLLARNPNLRVEGVTTPAKGAKKKRNPKDGVPILDILNNGPAHKAGQIEMNDHEAALDRELRDAQDKGEIQGYHFEEIGLKIGPKTWYFPDFVVFDKVGQCHVIEVKGFLRDDAAAKFKVANGLFPHIRFHMVRKKKQTWKELYGALHKPVPKTDGKACRITR
jgi:hypothetical protein